MRGKVAVGSFQLAESRCVCPNFRVARRSRYHKRRSVGRPNQSVIVATRAPARSSPPNLELERSAASPRLRVPGVDSFLSPPDVRALDSAAAGDLKTRLALSELLVPPASGSRDRIRARSERRASSPHRARHEAALQPQRAAFRSSAALR